MLCFMVVVIDEINLVCRQVPLNIEIVDDLFLVPGEIIGLEIRIKNNGIVDGFPIDRAFLRPDRPPVVSPHPAVIAAPKHWCPDKDCLAFKVRNDFILRQNYFAIVTFLLCFRICSELYCGWIAAECIQLAAGISEC